MTLTSFYVFLNSMSLGTGFIVDPQLYLRSNQVLIPFWNVNYCLLCLGYLFKPDWVVTNTVCANKIILPYKIIALLSGRAKSSTDKCNDGRMEPGKNT